MAQRRGWRERIEDGIYKSHRVACRSSADKKTGRRCKCPYEVKVLGRRPGESRNVVVYAVTLTEARDERSRLQQEARDDRNRKSQPTDDMTVEELCPVWVEKRRSRWQPSTRASRKDMWERIIKPTLGAEKVGDLTKTLIEDCAETWLRESGHYRTMELCVQIVSAMLGFAVDENIIPVNVASKVELPPRTTPIRRQPVLDEPVLRTFIDSCKTLRDKTIVGTAGMCGLRRGELCGLHWTDVYVDSKRMLVQRAIWQGKEAGKVVKTTKDIEPRWVAMPQELCELFVEYRKEQARVRGIVSDGPVWQGRGKRGSKYKGVMNEYLCPDSVTGLIGELLRRAELTTDKSSKGKPVTSVQGLRRTSGSIPLTKGVPIAIVASQLGHSRPSTTEKSYWELLHDSYLDQVSAAFEPPKSTDTVGETVGEVENDAS